MNKSERLRLKKRHEAIRRVGAFLRGLRTVSTRVMPFLLAVLVTLMVVVLLSR